MWILPKRLAEIVGKSLRTIQLMIKKGQFKTRPINKKSVEIYIPSLPSEWQILVTKVGEFKQPLNALTVLSPPAQIAAITKQSDAVLSIGSKSTAKQKKRMLIAQRIKARPADISKTAWVKSVASYFGISQSTVRRIEAEIKDFGVVGKPRTKSTSRSWSPEAVAYLKGYWVQAIKEVGECSKTTAWKALQIEAKNQGWSFGSRSAAFNLLGEVDHLMIAYARGGNRALDNYFYISRDANALQPMQIVIGDQHIFDWWIVDYESGIIRRPECYLWEDMCTKLIYGIAFDEKYNSGTVKKALKLGLFRFGAFDCTYNDNGIPECSKAINSIIDDLISLQMSAVDISELYKTPEGSYVVVDEDGEVIESARSQEEWRRKHRRIFANVKNAKAKDIERFFRSLEVRLDARHLPGRVATPGANAAVDEVERARLIKQKNNHELLTMEEFAMVVLEELKAYENTYHQSLKMTPMEKLKQKFNAGWRPRYFEREVVDLIFADRTTRKVERGRVTIDNISFIGEEMQIRNGKFADVGLWKFDGNTIEVRFNKYDMSYAYAVISEGDIRPLKRVETVTMLDDQAMTEAIALKRRQMKVVREAFQELSKPIEGIVLKSKVTPKITAAEEVKKTLPETVDGNLKEEVTKQIQSSTIPKVFPLKPLHSSRRERYQWCLDMIITGNILPKEDQQFMAGYEKSEEYETANFYWENYKKLGGTK